MGRGEVVSRNQAYNISFFQIRIFLTVADMQSFSQAAAELYMEQSTLSRQISKMEEHLGAELFLRDKRPVQLTDAGNILYQQWKPMLQAFEHSLESIEHVPGKIVISLLDYLDIVKDIPDLHGYLSTHVADCDINFNFLSYNEQQQRINDGNFDIILSADRMSLEHSQSLRCERLLDYGVSIYFLKSSPLSKKKCITADDLRDRKFIIIDPDVRAGIISILHSIFGENLPTVTKTLHSAKDFTHALTSDDEVMLLPDFIFDVSEPDTNSYHLPGTYYSLNAICKKSDHRPYMDLIIDALKSFWV